MPNRADLQQAAMQSHCHSFKLGNIGHNKKKNMGRKQSIGLN